MNSVEPSPYRKWTFYPFLMLTFHNVATGMCYYLVWREFRMRYLPRGADRSVWETSHAPDAYFVPKTSPQMQKHFRHQLRHKIWKGIIVPMLERLAAPFFWLCSFPPLSKLIARAWVLVCAYPWLHNFAVDMWRLCATSIKENWSDIQEVLSAWVRAAMRMLACSPLPTPSSRQALVDWTLLVPYSLLVWALNLNAFVLCWSEKQQQGDKGHEERLRTGWRWKWTRHGRARSLICCLFLIFSFSFFRPGTSI